MISAAPATLPPRSPTGPILTLGLYRAATVVMALTLLSSAFDQRAQGDTYRWVWFAPTVLAVTAAATACATWESARPERSQFGGRAYAVVGALALAVHPWVYLATPGDYHYPPLWPVIHSSIFLWPIVFGPRAARFVLPIAVVIFVQVRSIGVGSQALWEAALMTATLLICVVGIRSLTQADGWVRHANEENWTAAEELIRAESQQSEKRRWDGLVHDKVLGALRLAGRGGERVDEAAQELARGAVVALRETGRHAGSTSLAEVLDEHARQLGLNLELDVTGYCPDEVVTEAMTGACCEALSNIARHAGTRSAVVLGSLSPEQCRVVIKDLGVGIDDTHRAANTLGIDVSIVQRLATVGGHAEIRAGEHAGTVVELTWARPDPTAAIETRWREKDFRGLLALGLATQAIHIAIGIGYLDTVYSTRLEVAATAALLAATGTLSLASPTGRSWWFTAGVIALLPMVFLANVVNPSQSDWRFWFVGAFALPVALLSFRFHRLSGVAVAVIQFIAMVTSSWIAGNLSLVGIVGGWLVVLASAVMIGLLRMAIDRSTAYVAETARKSGEQRLESARAQARETESALRLAHLGGAALPMLDRIAESPRLTPDERAECRRIEAVTRDQLVAAAIVDDPLAAQIATARGRGARVEINAGDAVAGDIVPAFRSVCQWALQLATAGCTIVILWRPNEHGRLGSVSIVGAPVTDERRAQLTGSLAPADRAGVQLSHDEGSTLVELTAAG